MESVALGLAGFEATVDQAFASGKWKPKPGVYFVHEDEQGVLHCCAVGVAVLALGGKTLTESTHGKVLVKNFHITHEGVKGITHGFDAVEPVTEDSNYMAGYTTGKRLRERWVK